MYFSSQNIYHSREALVKTMHNLQSGIGLGISRKRMWKSEWSAASHRATSRHRYLHCDYGKKNRDTLNHIKGDHSHDTDKSALLEDQYLGHSFSTKNCLQTT